MAPLPARYLTGYFGSVPETELPICLLHLQTIRIQTAGGPRLPVTNEIMRKITAITSNT